MEFLSKNQKYCGELVDKVQYYSIGYVVSLVLSSEDRSGEYKYEGLKGVLFGNVFEYGLSNVGNSERFDGFLLFVEEVLNLTKQNYYEYFDDFKRCANMLVN
jgi:hypothetical protein